VQQLWASRVTVSGHVELEATANHPVLTPMGRQAVGELKTGDYLFVEDAGTGTYRMAKVVYTEQAARVVDRVYSLTTTSGLYEVNGTLVLDKQ